MPLIERLLEEFPPDQRQLCFSFERRDQGYLVRAMLTLPTGTLSAQTDVPIADEGAVIDQIVDKLAVAIRRHQQSLRLDAVEAGRRRVT